MRHARLWILGAAFGSFLAGMNTGLLLPNLWTAPEDSVPAEVRGDADYVAVLAASYGLSAAQAQSVRFVLQAAREEELAVLRAAEATQLPPALQAQLLAARARAEQRLRAVLTHEQRTRYDAESRPAGRGGFR